uniref:CTP synthase (glutamine hydrolyzing) n=1 Tax=Arundo donax TaxID=35708 RepID=A0A0A9D9W3_ARUDO
MRVGKKRTFFRTTDCKAARLYGNAKYVDERQRHRYEVSPDMVDQLKSTGVKFVGTDESGDRMEILELPSHPYFVGVQFLPEFKSRPGKPSPLFMGLIAASSGQLDAVSKSLGLGNRPIPMEVMSGSNSSDYTSGLEEGLLGLHISAAALAH